MSENEREVLMRSMNFKRGLVMSLGMLCILWTSLALAVPYDGSSVSINSAQFTFNSSTDIFSTAGDGSVTGPFASTEGANNVYASFFDSTGTRVSLFSGAKLEVTAVNFSGGLTSGTGGGFAIKDADEVLLLR